MADDDEQDAGERAEAFLRAGDARAAVAALERAGAGEGTVGSFVRDRAWDGWSAGLLDAALARFPADPEILKDDAGYRDRYLSDPMQALTA